MGTLTAVGEIAEPPSSVSEIADPDPDPIPTHVDLLPPYTSRHWNDWRWQMRQRIHLPSKLATRVGFRDMPDLERAAAHFPMAITPYYLSLIKRFDSSDPIFAMAVPQIHELQDSPYLRDDPLEEDHDMPVPGLVHRYPDRALLVTTSTCAMYCRHCTRKRVAGQRESSITPAGLRRAEAYLQKHPEIQDRKSVV